MALVDYYREVATSPFSTPQARALAQELLAQPRGLRDNVSDSDFLSATNTASNSSNQSQVSNVTFAAPQTAKSLSDSPWAQVALGLGGIALAGGLAWRILR